MGANPVRSVVFGRHDVVHLANITYIDAGTSNLLDVYRHRAQPVGAPTLVYLHGGGFRSGRKNREARPLLYHLASQGWICISANYRLGAPADAFPHNLIDVKKIIAWVRAHGHEYGADPSTIFLIGASAGAHLTATAALTANDPTFQPGFEEADTAITAGIALYGYYGQLGGDEQPPTSPLAYDGELPRSSSRTATRTRTHHPREPEPSSTTFGPYPPTRWSTPNSLAPGTPSICPTRCVSRTSSTASKGSPRGSAAVDRHVELGGPRADDVRQRIRPLVRDGT